MSAESESGVAGIVRSKLNDLVARLEEKLDADVLSYSGPLLYGSDLQLRSALESIESDRRARLAVVLNTPGGVVEIVERMVEVIRHHYGEVVMIVPDRAMSAGTVFAMAGDSISMDYYSRLGPIDPQVEKDGRLVPALSYLAQFKRLLRRARRGVLSDAEFALLARMDLAEIHQYEQARNLTNTLLRRWLSSYKFKNWTATETRKLPVDDQLREDRAQEIAEALNDQDRWHSHGRGISMQTLRNELNLRIDDFGEDHELASLIRSYHALLMDFLSVAGEKYVFFLHTRAFF